MRSVLSLLVLLLLSAQPAFAGGGGKLPFNKDHEKALADAKMQGKAAVLYFTADW